MENKLIYKFITNIFEKNYSNANSTLESLISEKLKSKIEKTVNKKNCNCGCDDCDKKNVKKKSKKVTKKG